MDGERTIDTDGGGAERSRLGPGRVGIIDVGSNSIRLVVYERASRAPSAENAARFPMPGPSSSIVSGPPFAKCPASQT